MKKTHYVTTALAAVVLLAGVQALHAQTVAMPALYDQAGTQVNAGPGTLGAGYYYLGGGPAVGGQEVYYYGNGTYYDPSTETYGGSVGDPSGIAGESVNYVAPTAEPGVPNTGAGGFAAYNWLILAVAGMAFLGSVAYIGSRAIVP